MSAVRIFALALAVTALSAGAQAQEQTDLRGTVSDAVPAAFDDELAGGDVAYATPDDDQATLQLQPVVVTTTPVLRYDTGSTSPIRLAAETAGQDPARMRKLSWSGRNDW
ncbi:MAG: hypothetical protein R3C00_03620 [Hyphomonas sp.]|nr:hypothetical protein [Hyphomonas sp.]MCB9961081.1 hypothetical protein [Hyphomonas sp.]MCB9970372.1 hypothetical protein [Hyphomonas sp.]